MCRINVLVALGGSLEIVSQAAPVAEHKTKRGKCLKFYRNSLLIGQRMPNELLKSASLLLTHKNYNEENEDGFHFS